MNLASIRGISCKSNLGDANRLSWHLRTAFQNFLMYINHLYNGYRYERLICTVATMI